MADVHYPHQHPLGGGTQRYNYQLGGGTQDYNQQQQYSRTQRSNQVVKAATAATAGGSLLLLSGITLAGTVISLTMATPLLVIFSPILVPAVITVFLLATGFLTSGGLGVAAVTVLSWLYRYVTGENPPGSDSVDQATDKMGSKVRDVKNRADQLRWEARDRAEGAGWDDTHQDELNWEPYHGQQQSSELEYRRQQQSNARWYSQVVKSATAATAGGSLVVLSGLTLAGTVIALTVATPLLVIFSPVLVPAVISVFLLATGFFTSGGFGIAAVTVLTWLYRYVTGGNPPGSDSLDQASDKLGSKARDVRNRAENAGRDMWNRAEDAGWEARDRADHAGRETKDRAEHAGGVGTDRIA